MKNIRVIAPIALVFAIIVICLVALGTSVPAVQGAPEMAPTPITQGPYNPNPRVVNLWRPATALTSDTRKCADIGGYNTLDLHWVIDQGTAVNTTTLKLQYGNFPDSYVDGASFASANVADVTNMQQYNMFGRYLCVYADVANSNPVTVTVVGLVK